MKQRRLDGRRRGFHGRRFVSGERAQPSIQAAFMASSFVLVNDAFANHRINDRHGCRIARCRPFFVAIVDRFDDILDVRAHFRAQRHIVLAQLDRLAGALLRRFNVCHGSLGRILESR